jgi:hypothetical protein
MGAKKTKKKTKRAIRESTPRKAGADTPHNAFTNDIVGVLAGRGVFLTRPKNDGLPLGHEPPLAQYASALRDSQALAQIPLIERNAVLNSLAATLRQGDYHSSRFSSFRQALDARRASVPGDVVWDALGGYVHFELRAYTGALRTSLDEIAYLIARRAGVASKRARSAPWGTNELFTEEDDKTRTLPEMNALKKHADWFDWLNAYRNSFYHHGWVSGSGHYDVQEGGVASLDPSMNALLVPDRESLKGKGKPFEWTWTEKNTVDTLARRFDDGLQSFLRAVFEGVWQVSQPARGTFPDDEYPTMMVAVPGPVYGVVDGESFVPLFSNRDTAIRFASGRQHLHELRRLPIVELAPGLRVVSFSTAGIETVLGPNQTHLYVLIDPAPHVQHEKLNCAQAERLDISDVLSDKLRMISVPFGGREVFMWTKPTLLHLDASSEAPGEGQHEGQT